MPSCVMPRETFTPVFGTSANLIVSFGMRPDRVGEVDADLALDDVERGGELDVRDVVPAEVDVHEARNGVLGLRVLVVLDSLQERVGAVALRR